MFAEALGTWLLEVAADHVLTSGADRARVQRAIEQAVELVVAQTEPELRSGVRRGLVGCFGQPVAEGLRVDPLQPVGPALAAAVAAQVGQLQGWRLQGPPPQPFLEAVPVRLAWLQERMREAVEACVRRADAETLSGLAAELRHAEVVSRIDSLGGHRRDTTPPAAPLGRLLAQENDPFSLLVHRVIEVAGAPKDLPALPSYVRRAHDEVLDRAVDEVQGEGYVGTRMVVLVGGSSTGKSRALWEAAQHLREKSRDWRLWNPHRPRPLLEALLDRTGGGGLRPRTVLWLNELQGFLDPSEAGLGEDVSAALLDFLSINGRGPFLVVGTLWPEHWSHLTAEPRSGVPDPHAQARALLAGRDTRIPDDFSGPELRRAEEMDDPRWREALHRGQSRPTQHLAGGHDLVDRYKSAKPTVQAVLDASGDARRLGHPGPLPIVFLREAAHGYLRDDVWQQLPRQERETWFDLALVELEGPSRGIPGPLTPTRPPSGAPPTGRLQLADYLEQHLRGVRRCSAPPATFWDAATTTIVEPAVHIALSRAAYARGRFRHAVLLANAAAKTGDTSVLCELAQQRDLAGDWQGAEHLYRAAAATGNAKATLALARMHELAGDLGEAEQLYTALADTGNGKALNALSWMRYRAGDMEGFEQLHDAADGIFLAEARSNLRETDEEAVPEPFGWADTDELHETAAENTRRLAEMHDALGDAASAEQFFRAAAEIGDASAWQQVARLREADGDLIGAEEIFRAVAEIGDASAWQQVARLREADGDLTGAQKVYLTAVDAGDIRALSGLARLLAAGDRRMEEQIDQFGLTADGDPQQSW